MESKTPRSQNRREIREKRLAYFDAAGQRPGVQPERGISIPSSRSEKVKDSKERAVAVSDSDGNYHGITYRELSLEGKNFNSVVNEEFLTTDRDLDTSRTSDILMETARDYLEVLKERESIRSKRSSNVSSKGNQHVISAASATPSYDLTNRSVTEVLKVLEERASHRRRDLPRLSDFSESEDEEDEISSPVDNDRKVVAEDEKFENFKKAANDWAENIQLLTAQGRKSGRSCRDSTSAIVMRHGVSGDAMSSHAIESSRLNGNVPSNCKVSSLPVDDVRLDEMFNGDPELMKREEELERQQSSILRKILENSHYSRDCLPEELSVMKSASNPTAKDALSTANTRKSESDVKSTFHPTRTNKATIAFSVDEILSQAKLYTATVSDERKVSNDKEFTSSPSACENPHRRYQSPPARRSVHFDCPPTPSDIDQQKRKSSSPDPSSSIDTKSSASVVSLMSIKDVSDRLEQLGINPHLLGVQLTSGTNSHSDEKPRRKNRARRYGKMCPDCGKYNADTVSWCLNCACALIGIEPQLLPRRRQRGNRSRNSSSLSNSSDSWKEKTSSSVDLDSSNGSSVLDQNAFKSDMRSSDVNETARSFDEESAVSRDRGDDLRQSDLYARGLPICVDVDDVISPIETTARTDTYTEVSTPAAVWNPKEMNVAQLLKQSRALLDEFGEEVEKVSASHPVKHDVTPRDLRTPVVTKNGPAQISSDSTVSSISLATPSPHRPNVPSHVQEDLKLNLSSSLEDSPNSPVKKSAVDIAVLDRQDVLALREASAASVKPESVPQLPLLISPPSTANGDRFHGVSPDDMLVEDFSWQDSNGGSNPDREDKPMQRNQQPVKSSVSKHRGRREPRRRPGSDASACRNIDHEEFEVRRPSTSTQQPAYRRRWKNSSLAWSAHHPSQLKKKPADYIVRQSNNSSNFRDRTHPNDISFMQKNGAILKQRNTNSIDPLLKNGETNQHSRKPQVYKSDEKETQTLSDRDFVPLASPAFENPDSDLIHEEEGTTEPLGFHDNTLAYLHQRNSRGWQHPNDSPWLYLADEVWLRIFRFLSPKDLSACAASCKRLHRVANDSSLWRWPVVKRKHEITEEELLTIGARRPISLKLKQCKGQNVTLQGLKAFFNLCATSLRKLCFSGCNHGAFSEDQFILLAAMFCPQLTSVDISFAHGVRDSTVRALAEECERLECVRLNGAQNVTDASVKFLAEMHGESLRKIELYCCFGVSSDAVRQLSKCCGKLTHVSFGSCNRISSSALIHFASHRREHLKSLDLRGMHSVLDSTITSIVAVCPNLESLTLSNCGSVSNSSIRAVANHCPRLRKLDVCGCNQVGSDSAQELVRKCKHLEELDFSSTCVDHKTVTCLAHTWTPKLKCLRLNFCCNLKEDGLIKLCSNSKSLSILYLYGIRNFGVSVFNRLRKEYPRIEVKSDDNLEGLDS